MKNRIHGHSNVALRHHLVASRTIHGNQVDVAVGHNISSAREAKQISFVRLARETKIGPESLAAYEDGSVRLTAIDLLTIASCLGVPISKFFAGL